MVKLAQDIQAAYEVESSNYGNPPDSTLYHLGLLDTFDPRAVEMNITPVPSIGQSTDAHHAAGPIDVQCLLRLHTRKWMARTTWKCYWSNSYRWR